MPLLSQFSISKIEKSEFKYLGMRLKQTADLAVSLSQDTKSIKDLPQGVNSLTEEEKQSALKSLVGQLLYLDLTQPDLAFLILDLSRSSSNTLDKRLRVARALLKKVREPAKSIIYHDTCRSSIDLRCYVDASYNQSTESGIKFNVRGSISGLMCHNDRFSPVQWKTAEIKRRISSVKLAELELDYGAGQLCYLKELYRHFSTKPITLTLLTDSQTTIDSLRSVRTILDRMNQHLLDNVKKC